MRGLGGTFALSFAYFRKYRNMSSFLLVPYFKFKSINNNVHTCIISHIYLKYLFQWLPRAYLRNIFLALARHLRLFMLSFLPFLLILLLYFMILQIYLCIDYSLHSFLTYFSNLSLSTISLGSPFLNSISVFLKQDRYCVLNCDVDTSPLWHPNILVNHDHD